MRRPPERALRPLLIWMAVVLLILLPLALAAFSPLLQWRQPVYIAAGFAGIIAMSLLLLQPLLAGGLLPGLDGPRGRRLHRWTGACLVTALFLHVAGLFVTSPPDVIDALLFRSPTPFSAWGVIAMAAVLATTLLAVLRRRLRVSPRTWRRAHVVLALVIVIGSAVHALLIEGTMEWVTKVGLCLAVVGATAKVAVGLRLWRRQV
ncbi:ferric reductase-like transmembrane domain-containing protein [Roseibium sp. CAU 1639]|uniref:Ferric reductase-like transmembrane domain-containing protein n=2 Tax=Roseibium sediminicola TaxID=2933272 RepID=A0ABT0GWI9_9HYPH|nr:ferric reductase-like transmembrane domain-containing protein [Roseibium sp. CAU 1639]